MSRFIFLVPQMHNEIVFLSLTYFTKYNVLQLYLFCWKWQDFILLYGRIIVCCANIAHWLYPLIYRWALRLTVVLLLWIALQWAWECRYLLHTDSDSFSTEKGEWTASCVKVTFYVCVIDFQIYGRWFGCKLHGLGSSMDSVGLCEDFTPVKWTFGLFLKDYFLPSL